MEKKSKFAQTSSKGTSGESKRSQDVVTNKLLPKSSRKREPAGTSNFIKTDQTRKSNTQKTKNFDKRPKPKGYCHGGSKEDFKVEETNSAELGSVMVPGSKKQSLNHLVNFHYAPRDMQSGNQAWSHRRSNTSYNYNSNRWLPPVQRHKYNKEQFLQANCQFVVSASGDYKMYLNNPDTLVEWKYIEQIRVYTYGNLFCPICLCAPVAGKMTRCGHVFCWACMLHYLALSDKSWRKCPICYESVQRGDLKSVVEVTQSMVNIGDTISLRLMRREKGSLIATEVSDCITSVPTTFFTVSENLCRQGYSKLLLANDKDILNIIERERMQLNMEKMGDPHSPENCFIDQALEELQKREDQLLNSVVQKSSKLPNEGILEKGNVFSEYQDKLQDDASSTQNTEEHDNTNSTRKEQLPTSSNNFVNTAISPNGQKFFYFYQVDGGQHIYLHAMNVKMLEIQYGSLDQCPRIISGKLLEKEASSFTEDLRRRMRYLWHLPLTCPFEIAEIELQNPLISPEVLDHFQDQLEMREKYRKRREREERKREKKIKEEENKRMGKYPAPKLHIESNHHFPQWQPEQQSSEVNIPSPPESAVSSSIASSPSTSELLQTELTAEFNTSSWGSGNDQDPSFAEMLRSSRLGLECNSSWPSVSGRIRTRSIAAAETRHDKAFGTLEEDFNSPPSFRQSFGDALAQAFQQSELLRTGERVENDISKGKKKKKKPKATVLISTAMARES